MISWVLMSEVNTVRLQTVGMRHVCGNIMGGIAAFLRTDGVEKNTIQFAEDGVNFEIKSVIKGGPEACGPYRQEESMDNPLKGMEWGLCHYVFADYGYIKRFDIDEWQKKVYTNRTMYE